VARTASLNRILELTSLLVTSTLTDGLPQWWVAYFTRT
jgi:hypothetical protein